MKKTVFTGSAVAIVTPFYSDGSVNYDKLKELIDYQIDNGTDAIVITGTTGESPTLSPKEHADVIKEAVKMVAGRVPVIAGTGSNDTAFGVAMSIDAERDGADALLLVTPYYNKASQEGLYRHFKAIADSVSIPVILYNVPSRTGTNITVDTCKRLAEIDNIVAIKEASGNISTVAQIIRECGDKLDVYSGNDDQIVPIMSLGGKGVISVLANVAPKQTHDICQLYLDGNVKESAALANKYLHLANALFCDVNPIPVKEAMNMLGFEVGECRLPLCETSEANKNKIKDALVEVGLIKE